MSCIKRASRLQSLQNLPWPDLRLPAEQALSQVHQFCGTIRQVKVSKCKLLLLLILQMSLSLILSWQALAIFSWENWTSWEGFWVHNFRVLAQFLAQELVSWLLMAHFLAPCPPLQSLIHIRLAPGCLSFSSFLDCKSAFIDPLPYASKFFKRLLKHMILA